MKLVFLGTSAAMPTENRGMTCICLVLDREILLFDAGEGAQVSFLKSKIGWNKKMTIFVTHLHELQSGKEINIENKTIKPSDVMGEKRPGKKIGISGDTRPTEKLVEFFKDCDYMTFDSTYSDELKEKAKENFHSTAKEAAE